MKRMKMAILILLLAVIPTGCGRTEPYLETFSTAEETETAKTPETELADLPEPEEEKETDTVYIYVCGEVNAPGVYALSDGSRIFEALALAGGLTEEADTTVINQAEPVTDGMMIRIPKAGEAVAEAEEPSDGRINLNTATADQLMTLPGIGSSKAESIIAYREEHGAFRDITELMQIPGIKEGVFSKLKEKVKV